VEKKSAENSDEIQMDSDGYGFLFVSFEKIQTI